jgi:hypothetical protein
MPGSDHLPNILPSSLFDIHKGCFSAEVSDLSGYRLLSSGAMPSFRMKSERTGAVITFKLVETVRDADDDILYWYFEGVSPSSHSLSVKIFND